MSQSGRGYRLAIGGVTIGLSFAEDAEALMLPSAYMDFATERTPEIALTVHSGALPEKRASRRKIFDAGPNWQLLQVGENLLIRTMFLEALCSPDYRVVDIFPRRRAAHSFSFAHLSYPLLEVIMISLLGSRDAILLHACGIAERGRGMLFCGSSGAGKSTLARIWQQAGPQSRILSDDRVIVQRMDGQLLASGTPWHGEAGLHWAATVPVSSLFFIEHAPENRLTAISPTEAVSCLLGRAFLPFWDKEAMGKGLALAEDITQQMKCRRLGFVPDGAIREFLKVDKMSTKGYSQQKSL